MSQDMRRVVLVTCGLWLIAAIGVVCWMANAISRNNVNAFRDWKSLYDYISVGGVVFSCLLLGAIAVPSTRRARVAVVVLGAFLLATGILGHYGFKHLSIVTNPGVGTIEHRPNAAETVLGFHYVCPSSGGYVAFGDGSVRYVDREHFATLRRADTPDQPPEFISPVKIPGENASGRTQEVHERLNHMNHLKQMAKGHLFFKPQDGIRTPLKPEHLTTYPAMTDELRKAISDGTYVWYFGWEATVSYAAERAKALWYDFASWASVYIAGFGAGALLAGLVLVIKRSNPALVLGSEPA